MNASAKILVIDDDRAMREFLSACLSEAGYQIQTAESASDAQKYLKNKTPDLILVDVMMPDMNGIELTRWIHEQPSTRNVPVIGLSGVSDDSTIEDALEMGAADYVTKPFSLEVLTKKIEVALGRARRSV